MSTNSTTVRVVAVLLGAGVLMAGCAFSMGIDAKTLVKSATVRVEIRYLDAAGRPLGRLDYGHGVLVSADGTLLTALHVVLPIPAALKSAATYELRLRSWEASTNDFTGLAGIVTAQNLLSQLERSPGSTVASCVGTTGVRLPCLSDQPSRIDDWAVLRFSPAIALSFLDVPGIWDDIPAELVETVGASLYVASTFVLGSPTEVIAVSIEDRMQPFLITSLLSRFFDPGVSGSPLVLEVPRFGGKVPGLFLLGIVVENQGEAPPYTHAKATLHESYRDALLRVVAAAKLESFRCTGTSQPFQRPLLENLAAYRQEATKTRLDNLTGCVQTFIPWLQTLRLERARFDGVFDADFQRISQRVKQIGPSFLALQDSTIRDSLEQIRRTAEKNSLDPALVLKEAALAASGTCAGCLRVDVDQPLSIVLDAAAMAEKPSEDDYTKRLAVWSERYGPARPQV